MHVRRDSNPQPAVLETAALPIELLTYLLGLFVRSSFVTPRAVLLVFDSAGLLFFVLGRRIISSLAVGALKCNNVSHDSISILIVFVAKQLSELATGISVKGESAFG